MADLKLKSSFSYKKNSHWVPQQRRRDYLYGIILKSIKIDSNRRDDLAISLKIKAYLTDLQNSSEHISKT